MVFAQTLVSAFLAFPILFYTKVHEFRKRWFHISFHKYSTLDQEALAYSSPLDLISTDSSYSYSALVSLYPPCLKTVNYPLLIELGTIWSFPSNTFSDVWLDFLVRMFFRSLRTSLMLCHYSRYKLLCCILPFRLWSLSWHYHRSRLFWLRRILRVLWVLGVFHFEAFWPPELATSFHTGGYEFWDLQSQTSLHRWNKLVR